jgi:hypothetical protein
MTLKLLLHFHTAIKLVLHYSIRFDRHSEELHFNFLTHCLLDWLIVTLLIQFSENL